MDDFWSTFFNEYSLWSFSLVILVFVFTATCFTREKKYLEQCSHNAGKLWNHWRHRSQDLDTTVPCVSSGFQRSDRISAPGSESTSTRKYSPPPLLKVGIWRVHPATWWPPHPLGQSCPHWLVASDRGTWHRHRMWDPLPAGSWVDLTWQLYNSTQSLHDKSISF